jgi:hypothetical protein
VFVAGRHLEEAKATAAAIGHGARGREIDVTVEASIAEALDGIDTVVSCIDQPRRNLLHAAIARGLRYTDITPHLVQLGRGAAYDEIDAAARASGARVVLGTGIVPGISNVIVRAVADSLGGVEAIETSLLLSASDPSGPASLDYFLQELTMPFDVHVNGTDHPARAFSDPRVIGRSALRHPSRDCPSSPRGWHDSLRLRFESVRPVSWLMNACVGRLSDAARIARRTTRPASHYAWTSSTTEGPLTRRWWVARRRTPPPPARAPQCAPWWKASSRSRAHGCPNRSSIRPASSRISPSTD